jgi:hypothetical protein
MNFKGLPELIQHARIGTELMDQNPKQYYHISAPYQGYDALSFTEEEFFKVRFEKDSSCVTFHEKKFVFGARNLKVENITNIVEKYSSPKLEGFGSNFGARPKAVNNVELGVFREGDYITLSESNLPNKGETEVTIQDYSSVFEKLVWDYKRGCLKDGTIISDSEVERLEYFYYLLEKNEKMCLIFNSVLENNPLFPL